jgi:hypothetical protein
MFLGAVGGTLGHVDAIERLPRVIGCLAGVVERCGQTFRRLGGSA